VETAAVLVGVLVSGWATALMAVPDIRSIAVNAIRWKSLPAIE
jgi:hypothetical protein